MILPDAEWRRHPGMICLLDALGAGQGMVRFVGGVVRDTLLGLPVSDIDCATVLLPEEVMRQVVAAGFKAVPTGLAHGTVTAVAEGRMIEITTLRKDVATDGRRAVVAFSRDWREDAARRDFTINALSADPVDGLIYDYFGGLADLEAGRVRFIGDPLARIAEDHLRILRFFRFHARFGKGDPDRASAEACMARANDLMALSRERIADELIKLLGLADPGSTIALMVDRGLFRPVLPEIAAPDRLPRLIEAERAAGEAPVAIRRLASLLPRDLATAEGVGVRLKLSNALRKRLVSAAEEPGGPCEMAYRIGVEGAIDRLLLASDPDIESVRMLRTWTVPRLPISGGDLVGMGVRQGPAVAAALADVERRWIAEAFPGEPRTREIARDVVDQNLSSRNA